MTLAERVEAALAQVWHRPHPATLDYDSDQLEPARARCGVMFVPGDRQTSWLYCPACMDHIRKTLG